MHVLVLSGQRVEVGVGGAGLAGLQPAEAAPQDLGDVVERRLTRREGVIPAPRVGDVEGVVDGVRARQQRGGAVEVPQEPVLLEPADVSHLPDRRLDEVLPRAQHLSVGESVEQLELDAPGVEQRRDQVVGDWLVG